jgi:Condensin complex subunit 2
LNKATSLLKLSYLHSSGVVDLKKLPRRAQDNDENPPESTSNTPHRKKSRQVSTIVKNPKALNGKLITNAVSDPFFTKLNTFVGETSRANRMLLNLLPTKRKGQHGFSSDVPFWDSSEQQIEKTTRRSIVSLKSSQCPSIANSIIRASEFIVVDDDFRVVT